MIRQRNNKRNHIIKKNDKDKKLYVSIISSINETSLPRRTFTSQKNHLSSDNSLGKEKKYPSHSKLEK